MSKRKENNVVICLKSDTCLKAPKTKGIFQNSILEGGPPKSAAPFRQTFFLAKVGGRSSLRTVQKSENLARVGFEDEICNVVFDGFPLNMFYRGVHPALVTMIQQSTFWTKPFPCSSFVWGRATGIGASFPSTSDPSPPLLQLFLNLRKFLRSTFTPSPLYLAVLGCTGLLWTVIGYTGLYWSVLGCSELNWALMDCTGLHWAALGCPGQCWTVLNCNGLHCTALVCIRLSWAVPDCTGLYWAALGSTELCWSVLGCKCAWREW